MPCPFLLCFCNHEQYHRGEKIAIPTTASYQRIHIRGGRAKARFCNLARDGFFLPTTYGIAQPCVFRAAPTAENRGLLLYRPPTDGGRAKPANPLRAQHCGCAVTGSAAFTTAVLYPVLFPSFATSEENATNRWEDCTAMMALCRSLRSVRGRRQRV